MSGIKVPYMPISNFDASEVSNKFADISEADEKEQNQNLMRGVEDSRGKCSGIILFILTGMGMEKYIDLFKKERITLDTFIQLNETDLQELGITDPKDREVIVKNLSIHQSNVNKLTVPVPENHVEDLKIVKNIFQQLMSMENYCALIELQMKKQKLTDYKINKEESACTYLKAFTKAALTQSQKLSQAIYDGHDSVIDQILRVYDPVLPNYMKKSLPVKEKKQKSLAFKLMTVIGFSSVVVLSVKYFLSRS